MATRKRTTASPLTWISRARQRLTSRMACFVWGAIFGNAVLSQPINPLNLLLQPPEQMLSANSREWLAHLREGVRNLSEDAKGLLFDAARDKAQELLPAGAALPNLTRPAQQPHAALTGSDFAACAQQFPNQQPLQLQQLSDQWSPYALCADAFAVLYSGLTKTPLLVVEQLNRQRLQQAAGQARTDQFYADDRIPTHLRAELRDYQGRGYDRGHLAAAANQPNARAMEQSFALTNMVPQDPTHNRKVWSKLESDVRKYVQRASGNVFVFTGALHEGTPTTMGRSGVWVPSHLFKLVYDESGQRAWAYVLPNNASAEISRPMDYASFVQRTQWHLLAGLPVTDSIR